MAKIYLSALLNAISGRLGDVVYAKFRGTDYTRLVSTSTLDPKTARALQLRANFSQIATAYSNLTPADQDLWREFANLKPYPGGALTAHRALNCNLLNASHSDLVANTSPPKTPGTPRFPKNFCVTVLSESQVCLQWTEPSDVNTYVTAHFKLHTGFCIIHPCYAGCPTFARKGTPRFVKTERADSLAIQHVHAWPSNTRLRYWLNSIDKSGRKSPVTHTIQVTTPL